MIENATNNSPENEYINILGYFSSRFTFTEVKHIGVKYCAIILPLINQQARPYWRGSNGVFKKWWFVIDRGWFCCPGELWLSEAHVNRLPYTDGGIVTPKHVHRWSRLKGKINLWLLVYVPTSYIGDSLPVLYVYRRRFCFRWILKLAKISWIFINWD